MTKRLNETGYLLLAALAEGKNHGYALAQRVSEITDGDVRPGAGTLYAALERLLSMELIEECGTEVVDGRARRRYRITSAGTTALSDRVEQLERRVGAINAALGAQ